MSLFYRRPLALFCCLFAVASLGGCFLNSEDKLTVALIFLGLFLLSGIFCILTKKHRAKLVTSLLCFIFIALALISGFVRIDTKRGQIEAYLNTETEAEMTVTSVVSASSMGSVYHVRWELQDVSLNGILRCEYSSNFDIGDRLSGTVIPRQVEALYTNASYYWARGLFVVLVSEEPPLTVTGTEKVDFHSKMKLLNAFLSEKLEDTLDRDTANMISAILLGNRTALDDVVLRDFRRAGVSHVLAISGMHLSLLVLLLERLLQLLGTHKRTRSVLIFFVAFFYLALTGFSLSTARSFIMVAFVYLAYLSGNQNDTMTSLFFALFLILAISPAAVWDIGMWMSFLAVLGLLVGTHFAKKLSEFLHKTRLRIQFERILARILSAIIISLFANIFVCIPMQFCFDELSLLSVVSTFIVSPFISALLLLAPFFMLTALVALFSFLTPALAFACRVLCEVATAIITLLSRLHGITVSLEFPFLPYIVILASLLLFLLLVLPLRRQFWIPLVPTLATVLAASLILTYNIHNAEQLTVDYLSFEESEMLVLTTTKDAVICDMSTGANQYLYDAIALSRERLQTEISAVVLTHYHTRHIYTFSRNADTFMIRRLYLPYPENADEYYIMYSIIYEANKRGVDVTLFDRGTEFSPVPNVILEISKPVYLKRSTHPTFLLSVSAFDERVTYVAESAHEAGLLLEQLEEQDSRPTYTILGTHGPKTKVPISCEALANAEMLFVYDQTILSYVAPTLMNDTGIIYGSDRITLRLGN